MKIVNIIGGLGNQMFQYAYALVLKNKFKTENVLLDVHHFNYYKLHNGFELKRIFKNINLEIADRTQLRKVTRYIPHYYLSRLIRKILPKLKSEYVEEHFYAYNDSPFNVIGDCYYEGYWQVFNYYAPIKDKIISAFKFPDPNGKNKEMVQEILSTNSVGIHIRRGDYLNHKDFKGICEIDYYRRAINDLDINSEAYKFYIFSNDISWCKMHIEPLVGNHEIKYVTQNCGYESFWDMYLMSNCRNLIIANSSFSWWAAFLNTNADRIYVPTKWINGKNIVDIYDPTWLKI